MIRVPNWSFLRIGRRKAARRAAFLRPCPEETVHPSTGSGRTVSGLVYREIRATTFPSGSTISITIGMAPMAWVEQERQGS